ncbi:MAG: phosphotransferase [Bacteroidota bacterium]
MNTIILAAGKIDYTQLPYGTHQSNATIPVNGKPVISWILDDLIQKGKSEITVVLRSDNHKLKQLLDKHYKQKLSLHLAEVSGSGSIIHSLEAGLKSTPNKHQEVEVILGDTLLYDSYSDLNDRVYVAEVNNSENWCIVEAENNTIKKLHDKTSIPGKSHLALCGYYCFSNAEYLKKCVEQILTSGARELSAVLMAYHQKIPLHIKQAEHWFDFGHLESMIHSKKSLMRPRHFNSITINPLLNTLTKVSEKTDKLNDELNWYLNLPEEIKILTPRIMLSQQDNHTITITQEYYGYPALSELFVYGDLSESVWESIIDYLFRIHQIFKAYPKSLQQQTLQEIYTTKTQERINQLLTQNDYWPSLWNKEIILINGKKYKNIGYLLEQLKPEIEQLSNYEQGCIIHGDYCLSNILYDVTNQIVRLIDPRGSFGEKGIYGDPRYDIAKLKHSISGLYDYLVGDLFKIKEIEDAHFEVAIFEDQKNKKLADFFIQCAESNGYDIREIKIIEALLFVSMIPYHADYFKRQQMMYLRSIELLTVLVNKNENSN